jgi:DNA-binding beta-propeller fold protein YncE
MIAPEPDRAAGRSLRRQSRWPWAAGAALVVAVVVLVVVTVTSRRQPAAVALPLRAVGELALPGDGSRFDYASLDSERGLLFVAHLGASEVIEVDVHSHRVLRTIAALPQVHGVLVVPTRHRVYATATGSNQLVTLDEDTGTVLSTAPTGEFPDGLAYDPHRGAVWATNEQGGTETVIDATTGVVRGTVALGGEVGNVAYDPTQDRMLVAVQGRNDVAVIDPGTLAITHRVPLPGCAHDHGLAVDPAGRLAFIACDANATLLTLDLSTGQITGTNTVGDQPDVLAYDPSAHRLYVAAESGWVSVLDLRNHQLSVSGSDHLADDAHVVAVDPGTHHSYYPVSVGANGHPALLEFAPAG